MKIEKQVTSVQISQQLNKLDIGLDSYFMWTLNGADKDGEYFEKLVKNTLANKQARILDWVPAFTAQELLEIMPGRNKYWEIDGKWSNDWWLKIEQSWAYRDSEPYNVWRVNYYSDMDTHVLIEEVVFEENLADGLGKMLIYLIEHNLWTPTKN